MRCGPSIKLFESHKIGIYQTWKLNKTSQNLIRNSRSMNQIIRRFLLVKTGIILVLDKESNITDF